LSFVFIAPDVVAAAARQLAGIGAQIGTAATAAVSAQQVTPAAADEVSAAIAALFGAHAQQFHGALAQASAAHAGFAETLTAGSGAYAAAEAAGVGSLRGGSGTGGVGFSVVFAVAGRDGAAAVRQRS